MTFYLIDLSNKSLIIGLIVFISFSSHLSISSLDMIISLNFFFSIFQFSILQSHSYSLGFHPYIFKKIFWKIYENKNIAFNWFFRVIFKLFCYSYFPFLYIHKKFLKNLWKQKYCTLLFGFLQSCIFAKKFWKIYENKNIVFKTI